MLDVLCVEDIEVDRREMAACTVVVAVDATTSTEDAADEVTEEEVEEAEEAGKGK